MKKLCIIIVGALVVAGAQAAVITWDKAQQATQDNQSNPGKSFNTANTVAAQGANAVASVAINGEVGSNLGVIEARDTGLLALWRQSDNPTADGFAVMSFDNANTESTLTSASATIGERAALTGEDSHYAWFIETSTGTFATSFTAFNGTTSVSLADASTVDWFAFDAVNDLNDNTVGVTIVNPDLTDIVSVGMTFDFGLDNNAHNANIGVRIDTFSATVIPEPGTYALLGGLLALGYVMVRRRV